MWSRSPRHGNRARNTPTSVMLLKLGRVRDSDPSKRYNVVKEGGRGERERERERERDEDRGRERERENGAINHNRMCHGYPTSYQKTVII